MVFESPLWLLGLLPWTALVLFLLPGNARLQAVPFLMFWRGATVASSKIARRFPPISVAFILLALLLVILATGKPIVFLKGHFSGDVSIVLDRGVSMALPSVLGQPFRGAISKCDRRLGSLGHQARVTLVAVPGDTIETAGDAWMASAQTMSPTIVPVKLGPIVADRLRRSSGLVFVLSDQPLNLIDSRIVHIWPDAPEPCVVMTAIAARSSPIPQMMIRLENHSGARAVALKITSEGAVTEQTIALPPVGQSIDRFFDLAVPGDLLTAEIDSNPKRNPWAHASLIRQRFGGMIITGPTLPDSIQRIAAVYSRKRERDLQAKAIIVSDQIIGADQTGIWLHHSSASAVPLGTWVVASHELTQNVRTWPTPGNAVMPPAGFKPLVSNAGIAVVAVREKPARQIWVNADFGDWEKTPDFVIFFANAFDWLGGDNWRFTSADQLPPGVTWPGIYQDSAGKQIAVNANSFLVENSPGDVNTASLAGAVNERVWLESWIMIAALACLTTAALFTLSA